MPNVRALVCVGNAIGSFGESRRFELDGREVKAWRLIMYLSVLYHASVLPNSTARLGRKTNGQDLERSGGARRLGTPISAGAGSSNGEKLLKMESL